MKIIEKKLDKAFQELSNGRLCWYCTNNAQAVHHLIRRANKTHRWNKDNGVPICYLCHGKLHNNELPEKKITFKVYSYKDFKKLFELSDKEFLESKAKEYGIKYSDSDFNKSSDSSCSTYKTHIKTPYEIERQRKVNELKRENSKKLYRLIKQKRNRKL